MFAGLLLFNVCIAGCIAAFALLLGHGAVFLCIVGWLAVLELQHCWLYTCFGIAGRIAVFCLGGWVTVLALLVGLLFLLLFYDIEAFALLAE